MTNTVNTILLLVGAVLIALGGGAALVRHTQMFQQSSYFLSRYFGWLKTAFSFRSAAALVLFLGAAAAIVWNSGLALALLGALSLLRILTAGSDKKKAIKKLVVTARVKRFFTVCGLTLLAALIGGFFCRYLFLAAAALAFLLPLWVTLCALITKPIEAAISAHYVRDAKRILREHRGLTVIGITGSYGKTGTKFILKRLLSERYNVVATPESFNTPMGVVRTVRENLTPPTEIFIAEMGAKKKGDIEEICRICEPVTGIVTSVGPQHLDTFGSIETVLDTKLELADRVKQKGGKIYLNTDNALLASRAGRYDTVSFGAGESADVRMENLTYGETGLSFEIVKGDLRFPVHSPLLGKHNAANITAAAALALDLGVTPAEIAYAVSTLKPVEHRLQMRPYLGGSLLLDDAYNANPEGSLAAVEVLGQFKGRKKILVTPGLVELGEREYECNKRLGAAGAAVADLILLVGQKRSVPLAEGAREAGFPEENLIIVDRFRDAAARLAALCDANTVVLFENDLPDNYAG